METPGLARTDATKSFAKAILRAAEDPSPKLRYPVHGAVILALTPRRPKGAADPGGHESGR